jgi:hypothetical protein
MISVLAAAYSACEAELASDYKCDFADGPRPSLASRNKSGHACAQTARVVNMAARRFVRLLRTAQNNVGVRFISQQRTSSNRSVVALVTAVAGGGAIYAYNAWIRHQHVVPVVHARNQETEDSEVSART